MANHNRSYLFYLVTAFFWFSLYAYVPYVAPYASYMGADLRLIGLITGAYGFTQMVIRFPLGLFSDKIGKRKIFVLLGMAFAAAAGFVVFFIPSPYALLLGRALGGVAASSWVTFTVLGTSYYPLTKTTKAMGHLSAYNALGRMVALLLGGLLAQRLGLEFAFLLGAAGGIIGLVMGLFIKEKPSETPTAPSLLQLLEVAKDKQLLACSVLGIISMFIAFATTFGFVPLAASLLDATQLQLGLLGVVSTVPGIFMAPLAGSIMPRKLGVCTTLVIGFILSGIGSAFIPFSSTLTMLFLVQIVTSIGAAILGTLLLGLCIYSIPTPRRATAMGFFQAVYGIGMFLGPFVMGQISYLFGLNIAFIFIGFVGIIGAICTVVYTKRGSIMY
ncbi:MAG: MFS transporter [Defluviitaleaceae bacterium]|nr:MFS transporter [Defluviitaleaceae bacterium]